MSVNSGDTHTGPGTFDGFRAGRDAPRYILVSGGRELNERQILEAMTNRQAREFAEHWANLWNNLDVDGVLEHFADDIVFSSPVALKVTGNARVEGKAALRAYWTRALENHPALRFAVIRTLWDSTSNTIAIIYDRDINGHRDRGAEILTFGTSGTVERGEAFYGVISP